MANGLMGLVSLLGGGLQGYNAQMNANAEADSQDEQRKADQAYREKVLNNQIENQKYDRDQTALTNATNAMSTYYQTWSRVPPNPQQVYDAHLGMAKLYGYSDPEGFARTSMQKFGMTLPDLNSPQSQQAPLNYGQTGFDTSIPTKSPLDFSDFTQKQSIPSGGPVLPPLQRAQPSDGTANQPTNVMDFSSVGLKPLVPFTKYEPLPEGTQVQSASPSQTQQQTLPAIPEIKDPFLKDLYSAYYSPFNADKNGTLKMITDYQDKEATRKKADADTQRATVDTLNATYKNLNDAWNSTTLYNNPDQQQNMQLSVLASAKSTLPDAQYQAFALTHPVAGQKIGTKDVPQYGPPTLSMAKEGKWSLPPLQKDVLQPLYHPDMLTSADISAKSASAFKTDLESRKMIAESPTWQKQAVAELNKTIAEGDASAIKAKLDSRELSWMDARTKAQIYRDIQAGNYDAARASLAPYEAAEMQAHAGLFNANIGQIGNKQQSYWETEKQRELGNISKITSKLDQLGLKKDANGNYIVPKNGVTINATDSQGRSYQQHIGADTINANINQLRSSQMRSGRIDQQLNNIRTPHMGEALIGTDFGTSGCVRGTRAVLQAKGLPFPNVDGVGKAKSLMLKYGYVPTNNPSEAHLFISKGSGGANNPSGLHMGAIDGGYSYQSDHVGKGGADTSLQRYPIPHGKGVIYYKYVGNGGTVQPKSANKSNKTETTRATTFQGKTISYTVK